MGGLQCAWVQVIERNKESTVNGREGVCGLGTPSQGLVLLTGAGCCGFAVCVLLHRLKSDLGIRNLGRGE